MIFFFLPVCRPEILQCWILSNNKQFSCIQGSLIPEYWNTFWVTWHVNQLNLYVNGVSRRNLLFEPFSTFFFKTLQFVHGISTGNDFTTKTAIMAIMIMVTIIKISLCISRYLNIWMMFQDHLQLSIKHWLSDCKDQLGMTGLCLLCHSKKCLTQQTSLSQIFLFLSLSLFWLCLVQFRAFSTFWNCYYVTIFWWSYCSYHLPLDKTYSNIYFRYYCKKKKIQFPYFYHKMEARVK